MLNTLHTHSVDRQTSTADHTESQSPLTHGWSVSGELWGVITKDKESSQTTWTEVEESHVIPQMWYEIAKLWCRATPGHPQKAALVPAKKGEKQPPFLRDWRKTKGKHPFHVRYLFVMEACM